MHIHGRWYAAIMTSQPDSELHFARPPIVEAVIERRYSKPIDLAIVESLRTRFEREYPAVGQLNEMSLAINPVGAPPQFSQNTVGYPVNKPRWKWNHCFHPLIQSCFSRVGPLIPAGMSSALVPRTYSGLRAA